MEVAPGAWRYAAPPFLLAGPLGLLSPLATLAALALGGAVLLFFRDPDRSPPSDGVLSPADGRVSVIREEGNRVRVGVFMNVTDVHVNRAPLSGRVESVEHEPGTHRPAFSKESDNNEKVHIGLSTCDLTLIAGAFARRIHPYVESGDELARGERLGHIAFGSRADVLLPASFDAADVEVRNGQRVRAGETVLARRDD
ncbi:phosphatidylserine decarboxylase [Haladaptatus paucihalophilus DX253]|uniref:Putative archaetidylserine decarboxylase proenzyme n=1 Tax=Haladaptatus paucihalophilus DX253 TaxID=797209 RepID=E7QYF5_HALPU|nr:MULTISPECIES: protein sorting system archaetidylserine decarboxylase [Haladaptatus]EFW90221.1 phosphatidylserine decarboxylase [Haladaptatus paucihalophilus DX253]GKZ12253.1 phosphatidylserine decarboxylase [Haladaptatus sp. T7]SHJ98476.1 phosphatidylserine decarboxylase [Haladaptatus paucihalophilus DX253]